MKHPTHDAIVDQSPKQKQERVDRLRVELEGLGFTIVNRAWLQALIAQNQRKTLAGMQS